MEYGGKVVLLYYEYIVFALLNEIEIHSDVPVILDIDDARLHWKNTSHQNRSH